MGKRYKTPPIIEALCECRFIPSQQWDLTIPGLIYEQVKDEFPQREQKMGIGVQFKPTERGIEHKIEPAPPRIQFHKKDKTALIQVAPDLLVVNQLKPYPTWKRFKPLILRALDVYEKIANPKGFNRIGLRYINKIDTDADYVELSEYFDFYPYLPKKLPQIHTNVISRVEIPYYNGRDQMLITIANAPQEIPEKISILLDIDYVMNKPGDLEIKDAGEWIEHAHSSVEDAFESCIKDKCRTLFDEVQ